MDFSPGLIKYFSFIALGLSLTIGYAVWRWSGGRKRAAAEGGEDWLAAELERARRERDLAPKQESGSGLEGPRWNAAEAETLDKARAFQATAGDSQDDRKDLA